MFETDIAPFALNFYDKWQILECPKRARLIVQSIGRCNCLVHNYPSGGYKNRCCDYKYDKD